MEDNRHFYEINETVLLNATNPELVILSEEIGVLPLHVQVVHDVPEFTPYETVVDDNKQVLFIRLGDVMAEELDNILDQFEQTEIAWRNDLETFNDRLTPSLPAGEKFVQNLEELFIIMMLFAREVYPGLDLEEGDLTDWLNDGLSFTIQQQQADGLLFQGIFTDDLTNPIQPI